MAKYTPCSPTELGRQIRALRKVERIYMNNAVRNYDCTTIKFCKTVAIPRLPNQEAKPSFQGWHNSSEKQIEEMNCTQLWTESDGNYSYTYYGWM